MVNYQDGKIYKIVSKTDPDSLVYIGSTAEPTLARRMVKHRDSYKRWKVGKTNNVKSFDLFEKYGIDDCQILLIETFPCKSKDELHAKEGEYIRKMDCVNKQIAGRTKDIWYQDNKERILEEHKDHYENNHATIRERQKVYYDNNKEKVLLQCKKHYEENIEKIKQWQLESVLCTCGKTYTKCNKARHEKSSFHLQSLKCDNPQV